MVLSLAEARSILGLTATEERQKEDDRKEKEAREKGREKEMNAGAARRDAKLLAMKKKADFEKAEALTRAAKLLETAQKNRTAVLAAARRGDSATVKRGIWEENVDADGVEKIPGHVSPEESEKPRVEKENLANLVFNEESKKENVGTSIIGGVDGISINGKSKKKKKKGKGEASNAKEALAASNEASKNPLSQSTPASKLPSTKSSENSSSKSKLQNLHRLEELTKRKLHYQSQLRKETQKRDSHQFTPVHNALQTGVFSIVKFFLSTNPPPTPTPPVNYSNGDPYYPFTKFVTSEAATTTWKWIEGLESSGIEMTEAQTNVWEEIKWSITQVPDFIAPAPYQKRRRLRT